MTDITLEPEIETEANIDELVDIINQKQIILHNDDYNTFEHVIVSLILHCDHRPEQAEQCAHIVHTKGKCSIKVGSIDKIKPIYEALKREQLTVTIQ